VDQGLACRKNVLGLAITFKYDRNTLSYLHKVVILEFIVMGILLTERFGKSQV